MNSQPSEYERDAEHLRLLSLFHYIVAGVAALVFLFPLIHVAVGVAFVSGAMQNTRGGGAPPPPEFGWLFVCLGSCFTVFGQALAVCIAVAGRKLAGRTAYTYCLVIAAVEILFHPLGTVLGIFTIIVLARPSVKALFQGQAYAAAPQG